MIYKLIKKYETKNFKSNKFKELFIAVIAKKFKIRFFFNFFGKQLKLTQLQ